MFKTVTVTWSDARAECYGVTRVVLWCSEGDGSQLNAALAYASEQSRVTGRLHRVHTFAPNDSQWRDKSAELHVLGRSL